MSKTIINIDTLNITFSLGAPAAQPRNAMADALRSAILGGLSGIEIHHRGFDDESGCACGDQPEANRAEQADDASPNNPATSTAEAATAEAAPQTAPELNEDNVIAFLKSDGRYKLRSLSAIAKHFGKDEGVVEELLEFMDDDDQVYTKSRRADRATLYGAH